MTDILKYKDFIGSVHFKAEDEVFFGKIEGINDLVTFEGNTVKEIKSAFKEAVDDYIMLCRETNKQVFETIKGIKKFYGKVNLNIDLNKSRKR